MAKGQSATSSKAARSQAGANDIPVYEHGKSLYLNSVRLQRTVKDDSKTGLVCEVVSTCMEAGPPLAGEQYIVSSLLCTCDALGRYINRVFGRPFCSYGPSAPLSD
jgi:hypothetical protein